MTELTPLAIPVSEHGEVAGLLLRPARAHAMLALAHGAGAGMNHPFLSSAAEALAARGIATLRYQFPFMQAARRRPPDPPDRLQATVRAAVAHAAARADGLPLLAGGKSLGGRMTSAAASAEPLPHVRGLVFLGFPLHPPKRPGVARADHLRQVALPMLFLQGTRDSLATLELMRGVAEGLGPRASLHVVDGADHGFDVLARSGRTSDEVIAELADTLAGWTAAL